MAERPKLLSELGKVRMNRVSGMGLNGLAASTIGFVMLGCIAIGYFGGVWLDRKLGSTWAMPAGAFLGMAAGFVEMFRTLRQIGKNTKWPGAKSDGEESDQVIEREREKTGQEADAPAPKIENPPVTRQRLFDVPPPPLPEYESRSSVTASPSAEEINARLHEGLTKKTDETQRGDNES